MFQKLQEELTGLATSLTDTAIGEVKQQHARTSKILFQAVAFVHRAANLVAEASAVAAEPPKPRGRKPGTNGTVAVEMPTAPPPTPAASARTARIPVVEVEAEAEAPARRRAK